MSRIINDCGRQIVMDSEGLRLEAYKCPAGIMTIGYGHTGSIESEEIPEDEVKPGMKITKHQAETLLEYDLKRFEELVERVVKVQINGNQFSALVSFAFNVGPGRRDLKDGFVTLKNGRPSSLLAKVNASAFLSAAEEFPKWNKAGGVVLPGLVKRRAAERALFLTVPS